MLFLTTIAAVSAGVTLTPCEVPRARGPAQCGVYAVWEDRSKRTGRKIPLRIAILKATEPGARPDPLVILQGGPGDAPSFNASFYDRVFTSVRRARDLVLIDPRGTGKSAPLACPELAAPDPDQTLNEQWLDPAAVRACRARLEDRTDLKQYTTAIVADDLDEVLGVLGYSSVNLYGTSYGTRLAQVLMARHPTRVRTATLKGVVPPSEATPTSLAPAAEAAWRDLVARCTEDPECAAVHPRLDAEFRAWLDQLERAPIRLAISATPSRAATTLVVTRGLFAEAFRNLLYTPQAAAGAPRLIARLRGGDVGAMADIVYSTRTLTGGARLAAGFYLSVTCTEDVPFIAETAGVQARAAFAGDYRLRQQQAACAAWPRGVVPTDHGQPLHSDVPTLVLSGESDPATPQSGGALVARTLTRGKAVVLQNNGHPIGSAEGCVAAMVGTLLDTGLAAAVDASCVSRIPRVPFEATK